MAPWLLTSLPPYLITSLPPYLLTSLPLQLLSSLHPQLLTSLAPLKPGSSHSFLPYSSLPLTLSPPVKNDRSSVDIRNRPRIPVPDEVSGPLPGLRLMTRTRTTACRTPTAWQARAAPAPRDQGDPGDYYRPPHRAFNSTWRLIVLFEIKKASSCKDQRH